MSPDYAMQAAAAEMLFAYGRYADEHNLDGLRELVVEDVVYVGPDETRTGVEDWLQIFDRVAESGATHVVHAVHNVLVRHSDDEVVTAVAHYQATAFFEEESRMVFGQYEVTLRRPQLKFTKMVVTVDRIVTLPQAAQRSRPLG